MRLRASSTSQFVHKFDINTNPTDAFAREGGGLTKEHKMPKAWPVLASALNRQLASTFSALKQRTFPNCLFTDFNKAKSICEPVFYKSLALFKRQGFEFCKESICAFTIK